MVKVWDCPVDYIRLTKPLVRDTFWTNLVQDMSVSGQQRNLLVRRIRDDYFEVVDGNKRLAAAFSLGWTTVKCELVT